MLALVINDLNTKVMFPLSFFLHAKSRTSNLGSVPLACKNPAFQESQLWTDLELFDATELCSCLSKPPVRTFKPPQTKDLASPNPEHEEMANLLHGIKATVISARQEGNA